IYTMDICRHCGDRRLPPPHDWAGEHDRFPGASEPETGGLGPCGDLHDWVPLPRVVVVGLRLCQDCVVASVNGDYAGLSPERANEIRNGLQRLAARYGGRLVPDFDPLNDEIYKFYMRQCDACGTRLGEYRARFADIS